MSKEGEESLTLVTWNINGIRSFSNEELKRKWKEDFPSDLFCVQETKITRDMLDEPTAFWPNSTSYFAFSRKRSGYSGVATFCKSYLTPVKAEEGLGGTLPSSKFDDSVGGTPVLDDLDDDELKALDAEGRCVITQHTLKVTSTGEEKLLVVINVYCPRFDPEKPEREKYKLDFYYLLESRAKIFHKRGYFVIICGDINTSHKEIDHCDPYEEFSENPYRKWLDGLLGKEDTKGAFFYDAFRISHPSEENAFTCWNTKLNCRSTNYGTRIDYFFINSLLLNFFKSCDILASIGGSDHCPVRLVLSDLSTIPSNKPPKFCTKYYPELIGKQTTLTKFLVPTKRKEIEEIKREPQKKRNLESQQTKLSNFFAIVPKNDERVKKEEPVCVPNLQSSESVAAWKTLLKADTRPPVAPNCSGHNESAVLRTVKKKGQNLGRQFWVCARGEGRSDNPEARCNFFKWNKSK